MTSRRTSLGPIAAPVCHWPTASTMKLPGPYCASVPVHKHPFSRYAYVEAGQILVMNLQTGTDAQYGPGDFIVEAVDQWHTGAAIGAKDVRLLVIDQHPPGEAVTVSRTP